MGGSSCNARSGSSWEISEHLDCMTYTAAGLVVPLRPDDMPRVLAHGAPAGLVPDMAQEEDARLVAWGVRDLQTQRAGWPSPARS